MTRFPAVYFYYSSCEKLAMLKFLLTIVLLEFVSSKSNYCDPNLCSKGRKHIACNNYGKFSAKCPGNREMVLLTANDTKTIVAQHNKFRNRIASGGEIGFKPANRMSTMVNFLKHPSIYRSVLMTKSLQTWDPELAELAALNVKQCKIQHDSCRNTNQFKLAGQNLASRPTTGDDEPLNDYIKKTITNWYNEYKDARQSDIDKCCNSASGKTIGHFTQLVTDRAIKVGCAISRFTEGKWKTTLFACNYAFTNLFGAKVYTSGVSASGCTLGPNPNYPALCKIKEPIKASM